MKTKDQAIKAAQQAANHYNRPMVAYTHSGWTHWGYGSESWVEGMEMPSEMIKVYPQISKTGL